MNKDPFKLERKRISFAQHKKYKELIKLYSKNLPEIPNGNTSKVWDRLNMREDLNNNRNYMEEDKLRWIASKIPNKISLLNIGFGSANLENLVLNDKREIDWQGIDLSNKSVKIASKKYKQAKFFVGSIEDFKAKKDSFNYVVALEVLEHISTTNIFSVLKKVNQILKPNGIFIMSVPLNEDLENMIKRGYNPNEHVRIYDYHLLKAELEISKFNVIAFKYIYAFRKYYFIKTLLVKYFFRTLKKPNGVILIAKKK